MNENILHHIWLHKKFAINSLFTTDGEKIEIIDFGQLQQYSGPDFFNAKVIIGNQKWAGNIEIHVKSSDWYIHQHEKDEKYNNVILHVVWEHDVEIYRKDNTPISVLELKSVVSKSDLSSINRLLQKKNWINCEKSISKISKYTLVSWKERLFIERLERKSKEILELLLMLETDWEAVFFVLLSKNLGLNINGANFYILAKQIPFKIVRKESHNIMHLEALFLGKANLLNLKFEDVYASELKEIWSYLKHKYDLTENYVEFHKVRPDNFPTVRLAQLAALYFKNQNIFQDIIDSVNLDAISKVLDCKVSDYWKWHYNFDKPCNKKSRVISKDMIDLIFLNTILPLKFTYSKYKGEDLSIVVENLLEATRSIKSENNNVINRFKLLGLSCDNAFDSQSLLQLKKEYCENFKCLNCAIGIEILKKNHTFED